MNINNPIIRFIISICGGLLGCFSAQWWINRKKRLAEKKWGFTQRPECNYSHGHVLIFKRPPTKNDDNHSHFTVWVQQIVNGRKTEYKGWVYFKKHNEESTGKWIPL